MDSFVINYWAIVVSTIISVVLGFLWYGPIFGKTWMALSGINKDDCNGNEKKKDMWKSTIFMIVGSLITSYVLLHSLVYGSAYTHVYGIKAGLMVGFWNWLGFIAPVTIGVVLWERKSWKLWFLNAGYYLANLLIIGMVLSVWM